MNRRNFLTALGLGAAGLVLDPERLLWVPGQKTIFLPPTTILAPPAISLEEIRITEGRWVDNPFEPEAAGRYVVAVRDGLYGRTRRYEFDSRWRPLHATSPAEINRIYHETGIMPPRGWDGKEYRG
jgi:hypothetical protein